MLKHAPKLFDDDWAPFPCFRGIAGCSPPNKNVLTDKKSEDLINMLKCAVSNTVWRL